jgi:GT2 family glycosyltransferase
MTAREGSARHDGGSASDFGVSIIVVTHNEGENLVRTVERLIATAWENSEVIVVDDFSTDGSVEPLRGDEFNIRIVKPRMHLGPTSARNFGAGFATRPLLLWSDAHVDPDPGWCDAFAQVLALHKVGAVGPAAVVMGDGASVGYGTRWKNAALEIEWLPCISQEPYPVPMLGGFFIAMRREVFDRVGGFDEGLIRWGGADSELTFRLWALGYECRVVPTVRVEHLFRSVFPYLVDATAVLHNLLRIAVVHFDDARLRDVIEAQRGNPLFPAAMARVLASDVSQRRAAMRAGRVLEDDAFFERFRMPGLSLELDGSGVAEQPAAAVTA